MHTRDAKTQSFYGAFFFFGHIFLYTKRDVFYKRVRDKKIKEKKERERRMGEKCVGVRALLNVPADGQTWAFSH